MTGLLFAFAYWLVIGIAAFGGVVLCVYLWLLVSEWLDEWQWREDERRLNALIAAQVGRPYDQDDPLEQLLTLPCAPDPKWRVA